MAYDDDDVDHSRRQLQARGRRKKPLRDLDDIEAEKRFKQDLINLLKSVRSRDEFSTELEKLTARYGRRVGVEQRNRALAAFDEYWRKR